MAGLDVPTDERDEAEAADTEAQREDTDEDAEAVVCRSAWEL